MCVFIPNKRRNKPQDNNQSFIEIVNLFEVHCEHDSIVLKVESRYYSAVDVPLSELHLADYTCRGYVDPFNDDMWVFDIPNFLACGTILTVSR